MPKDPKEYLDFANSEVTSRLSDGIKKELIEEGFPSYMCYSFIETAKETNSVILSRLPGGVGTDLIEQGYDLKGFHIKAKSCNWGPMAGFICQLPLFNKLGIDKVSYNTENIGHYLKHLDHFNGNKTNIAAYELQRAGERAIVEARKKADTDRQVSIQEINKYYIPEVTRINKFYDEEILKILTTARTEEQTSGEWSGENAIKAGNPFIPLRRKLTHGDVLDMRGVDDVLILSPRLIYGTAKNVTNEKEPSKNKPTIITEFLLVKADDDIWDIYHGRILYKKRDSDTAFNNSFDGKVITDKVEEKVRTKYQKFIGQIFEIYKENPYKIEAVFEGEGYIARINAELAKTNIFGRIVGDATFYKVRGFVNPFPPFELGPKYYKNAVSGDYDLFGIWPSMNLTQDELIRQSELVTGKYTRMGGKMFTTYFGNKGNFAIEFIPGFKELNPDGSIPILKESAEFGNMHSWGHLVSGLLNSFGASFIEAFADGTRSTANKGFHSDEGGRPGIMEVEFPIAVFMPKKMVSKALNNKYDKELKVKTIAARTTTVSTYGGLIKSPEELLLFMLECMNNDYRILVHYRWLIHLLYNTLPIIDVKREFRKALDNNIANVRKYAKDGFDINNPDMKEFDAIDNNQDIIDAMMAPNHASYLADLKKILGCENDTSEFFERFRSLMFSYAFLSEQPSMGKRFEVEQLMFNYPIKQA
ncbi:hypothetical protein FA048_16460 [Pedobacter polaris]|uniref:Anthrax toxin edema factor central domain-containing protein n=1 Tax=Pedobacter polaris TaxID=2571273 RepID=A0A4U1CKR6_9SPHI|nr:anthrax toxin-like adenylyl cyclase domain-containing protein [Pedobacter polaris]TKC06789.1 hypothetical protein FA048_16460 [Pedobacter polaris]